MTNQIYTIVKVRSCGCASNTVGLLLRGESVDQTYTRVILLILQ